ncbi:MAG: helix-turn-helix domain-containing protein [Clostridiales bacterium]|nr:helix-turn-helix domain-containing protein [Clostridiales bacterium]
MLYTNDNVSSVLNELWEIYNHLRDWERDLDIEIIQNGNLQTLIDLSEDIIGCPVILYDGAQKVLASTRHLYPQSPKDTFFKNVVEKGYLFSHAMDTFVDGGTFSKLYKDGYSIENDVFQQELKNIYLLLSIQNSTIGHLTAMCIRQEDVSWTKELLLLLESKVIHCFELHRQSDLIRHQIFDYLFAELVENTSLTEADIQDKMIHLNIANKKSFQLLCLDFSTNPKIPMEILTHEMSSLMGTNHITIYHGHIFILLSSEKTDIDKDYFAGLQSLLKNTLNRYAGKCASSLAFSSMSALREAYLQTSFVIDYLNSDRYTGTSTSVFYHYEDFRIVHMIDLCNKTIPVEIFLNPHIVNLKNRSDQQDNLMILKTYLNKNCNITDTANEAHMHRNSIIYHLKQMSEEFQIHTDTPEERLDLMLSLKILDYLS